MSTTNQYIKKLMFSNSKNKERET